MYLTLSRFPALAFVFVLCASFLLTQCGEPSFTPKPRGYPKVTYPDKTYRSFDKDFCAFTFEYPAYARIVKDTNYFEQQPAHPCWFDIYFQDFDSRIHCSYYPIGADKSLEELKADAFELVDWHQKKANYIEERAIQKPNGVAGFAFDLSGPAASPFQFFLTDSTDHFMRGALYFNTQTRPDSLAPISEFIKADIYQLIETFEWREGGEANPEN